MVLTKTDFSIFYFGSDVVVLKELIFHSFYSWSVCVHERTDF